MKCFCAIVYVFSTLAVGNALSWSKTYNLKAVLSIPSANIEEPYEIWTDGDTGNSRIDFYDGLDKMYKLKTAANKFLYYKETSLLFSFIYNTYLGWRVDNLRYRSNPSSGVNPPYEYSTDIRTYSIHPASSENGPSRNVCRIYDATDYLVKIVTRNNYLPGPEQKFRHIGVDRIRNFDTSKWQYEIGYKSEGLDFKYTYVVWVKSEGPVNVPVKFEFTMKVDGIEMDYFRHDYTYFAITKPDPKIFEIPNSVNCKIETAPGHEPIDPLMEYINPMLENDRVSRAFDSFKLEHDKMYKDDTEHRNRQQFFKNNMRLINSVNRQHKSYSLSLNQFADLSDSELSKLGGIRITTNISQYEYNDDEDDDFIGDKVKAFDWRSFKAISPIKDQTILCGSCYAFTSAAAIESTMYIYSGCRGQVKEVSEQAIVDCTWRSGGKRGNSGCDSGDLYYTLSYIKRFGVPTRDSYGPYLAMEGVCRINEAGKKFKITDFTKIPKDKTKIQKALVKNGPLALALNGNPKTFMFYSKGIYNNENCANEDTDLSHGVTLIGFGEDSGEEYWILKNSYGTKWGENGFMRITTKSNICGVMNLVFSVQFKRKNKINKCFLKENASNVTKSRF